MSSSIAKPIVNGFSYDSLKQDLLKSSKPENASESKVDSSGGPNFVSKMEKQRLVYELAAANDTKNDEPECNNGSIDTLIPKAAKLLLSHSTSEDYDEDDINSDPDEYDFPDDVSDSDHSDNDTNGIISDYSFPNNGTFEDSPYVDYGLEVIQEETASQMSSDNEEELDRSMEIYDETLNHKKFKDVVKDCEALSLLDYTPPTSCEYTDLPVEEQSSNGADEIVAKHIRIPSDWDPEPLSRRLYAMIEPKNGGGEANLAPSISGYLSVLSGNRKKGTFWNAWKKKFYVVTDGKLYGYEKEDRKDLIHSANLAGAKIDFLDPSDFVSKDKESTMTNKIIGVDDGKGHYLVLLCPSAVETMKWVSTLKSAGSFVVTYRAPTLICNPSLFRDVVLFDFGTTSVRAGILGDQPSLPMCFIPSVMSENTQTKECLYGHEVYTTNNRKNAKIKFPFECTSKICQNTFDVNAMKGFMYKIFEILAIKPEGYKILINLPRKVDATTRKQMLRLLFDVFQFQSVLLCHQSVVSFWAYSVDNGIVVDLGERCDIVPVSQGFVLNQAWRRSSLLGSSSLKHCLRQALGPQENGLYLSTPAENLVLRHISENFICIGNGESRKAKDSQEVIVEMDLRDILSFSNLIEVDQTILRTVGEGFFNPDYYGLDCDSLQKLLFSSLQECGMDIKKEMSQNILLVGGCTLIPGFCERLQLELTKLCPPHIKPKIQASPYRYHASYIGASVLVSSGVFKQSLLHRKDYDGGVGPSHWLV